MKSYHVFVIQPDGSETLITQAKAPTLAQLQQWTGGYIQEAPHFTSLDRDRHYSRGKAFCNEEGLLNRLPFNSRATNDWQNALDRTGKPYDRTRARLVGTVVFYAKAEVADVEA